MERAILISIRPEWVEKILNGKKTIEIRKSAPKEHGYKVYIYCTKRKLLSGKNVYINNKEKRNTLGVADHWGSNLETLLINENTAYEYETYKANGKVVAEFRLPPVEHIEQHQVYNAQVLRKYAGLTIQQLGEYTKGKDFYAWHIEDLVVYDKPKELHEFGVYDVRWSKARKCEMPGWFPLKRPPQSWCYVEK